MIILRQHNFSDDEVYSQREFASIRMAKKVAGGVAEGIAHGELNGKMIAAGFRDHLGRNEGKLLNNPALLDKVMNATANTSIKRVFKAQGWRKPDASTIKEIKSVKIPEAIQHNIRDYELKKKGLYKLPKMSWK